MHLFYVRTMTMRYEIENEQLRVTADTHGAELVAVTDKKTGAEMMWNADPAVWDWHAPILFPYCGKLRDGHYQLDGQRYPGVMHGFARNMEHEFLGADGSAMGFRLRSNEETRKLLPREFDFETTFALHGRCLRHNIKVTNRGGKELRFGLGYHPAFAFPFDEKHTTRDYELRFDCPQSPVVLKNIESGPDEGFACDEKYALEENCISLELDDRMFDRDSICLSELSARTMSIVEKDTGRRVTLDISPFPYVLLWSMLGFDTLKFLCVEPWHSLQDRVDASGNWEEKPCAAVLAPGESWETHLDMTFDR